MKKIFLIVFSLLTLNSFAQKSDLRPLVSKKADAIEQKVISWRRDLHEHPELGNNEVRTAGIIAKHLESLGIEVKPVSGRPGLWVF
jgi:metal-dependent amidase/aminoacylase/carboxypeptidase family protein